MMNTEPNGTALGIYVVMARYWSDALDMIQECEDKDALEMLLAMLTLEAPKDDDRKLNELFIEPVKRRIARIA